MKFQVKVLNDSMDKLRKELAKIDSSKQHAKAGLMGSEVHDADSGLTQVQLGIIHEYGTSKIPARPFIGASFNANRRDYESLLTRAVKAAGERGAAVFTKMLGGIAAKMAAEMKKYVTLGNNLTPNAESTVRAKGSDRPLVDTGRLVNSITWKVERD